MVFLILMLNMFKKLFRDTALIDISVRVYSTEISRVIQIHLKRSISYVVALVNADVNPDKSVIWKILNLKSCNRKFKMLTALLSR